MVFHYVHITILTIFVLKEMTVYFSCVRRAIRKLKDEKHEHKSKSVAMVADRRLDDDNAYTRAPRA